MHFLIRTPSSQLQLWYFLLDNLAENLDLLHVIDLFLISSKCHRSGACRIVGISVYVNLKSGLAHRNVCPDKENIVNTSPLCSVCTKIMIHKKAIMLFVLLLILTSLLDETAAPVRGLIIYKALPACQGQVYFLMKSLHRDFLISQVSGQVEPNMLRMLRPL